ncbi:hypothetical protein O6H91_07G009800 [Diphasiastrum complanatum]|uniref:Uncharacterized protein n=1 Tax=Diphasiastrum complanatum TaxID=34168 RepID=A0ACC2D2J1_DIPCM|nr:hypothetical protein O6H91_07G009800 [Diphasiastrum complanatum]
MGLILGKINVETPKYEVLAKGKDYEIREYVPALIAEVTYDPSQMKNGRGGGFMILANYIGALGKPNNVKAQSKDGDIADEDSKGEKIAMTAPVLMQEGMATAHRDGQKIAMTAPVLTSQGEANTEGERIEMTAPVLMHESDGKTANENKTMMTMQFVLPSQYTVDSVPRPTDPRVSVKELPRRKYGVLTFSGIANDSLTEKKVQELRKTLQEAGYNITGEHILAQYNPPWTVPFLRTNEVLLPVD